MTLSLSQVCLVSVFPPGVHLSARTSPTLPVTKEEVTLSQTCPIIITLGHTAMTAHHQILVGTVLSLHTSASPGRSWFLLNVSNGVSLPRFSVEQTTPWAADGVAP